MTKDLGHRSTIADRGRQWREREDRGDLTLEIFTKLEQSQMPLHVIGAVHVPAVHSRLSQPSEFVHAAPSGTIGAHTAGSTPRSQNAATPQSPVGQGAPSAGTSSQTPIVSSAVFAQALVWH